jgi:tRNA (guanosine-2'-O-)-methyltransferase
MWILIFFFVAMKEMALKQELITYLKGFMSDRRVQRFDDVIAMRSDYMRVVLENVYQAHNASAVVRSCDCFGIQHVHFIENRNRMKLSDDVAMGSSNWLSIHRHNEKENNTVETLQDLKKAGYRIIATTPHKDDFTPDTLPIDQKIALVFGTEIDGISPEVVQMADGFVKIPMYGFTESFNISVSAAICMYALSSRIRAEVPNHLLSEEEKTDIYLDWLKCSVEKSEALIQNYLQHK